MCFCCEDFDFLIGEIFKRLKHLIVDGGIRNIIFFKVSTIYGALTVLEELFILIPVVVELCLLKLAFSENNSDILLYQIMLCPPPVCDFRLDVIRFAKFQIVKAGELSFDIRQTNHEIRP
jgi:hypothetical protein